MIRFFNKCQIERQKPEMLLFSFFLALGLLTVTATWPSCKFTLVVSLIVVVFVFVFVFLIVFEGEVYISYCSKLQHGASSLHKKCRHKLSPGKN